MSCRFVHENRTYDYLSTGNPPTLSSVSIKLWQLLPLPIQCHTVNGRQCYRSLYSNIIILLIPLFLRVLKMRTGDTDLEHDAHLTALHPAEWERKVQAGHGDRLLRLRSAQHQHEYNGQAKVMRSWNFTIILLLNFTSDCQPAIVLKSQESTDSLTPGGSKESRPAYYILRYAVK